MDILVRKTEIRCRFFVVILGMLLTIAMLSASGACPFQNVAQIQISVNNDMLQKPAKKQTKGEVPLQNGIGKRMWRKRSKEIKSERTSSSQGWRKYSHYRITKITLKRT